MYVIHGITLTLQLPIALLAILSAENAQMDYPPLAVLVGLMLC